MFSEYVWQKDNKMEEVVKNYITFLWKNIIYMIESYTLKGEPITVLRICKDSDNCELTDIPPFIKIGENISGIYILY